MNEKTDSERLAVIEEVVTRTDHRLFGNGQPGEISSIKGRIAKLENWRWWVVGVAVGLGIALGGSIRPIVEAFAK